MGYIYRVDRKSRIKKVEATEEDIIVDVIGCLCRDERGKEWLPCGYMTFVFDKKGKCVFTNTSANDKVEKGSMKRVREMVGELC